MLSIRWRGDKRLIRNTFDVENDLWGGCRKALESMQNKAVQHIIDNWNGSSPSSSFERPAIVHGSLNAAVKSNLRHSRERISLLGNAKGRLETDLVIDTSKHDRSGRARSYSAALEDGFRHSRSGKMVSPRPYLRPSLETLKAIAAFELKRNIKFKSRY